MSKFKVIFAWEYGRNFGHISALVNVSRWVERAGGEPVWILPAQKLCSIPKVLLCWQCIEGPQLRPSDRSRGKILSYADVLLSYGFCSDSNLRGAVRSYQGLFESLSPALIVMDCAPVAQMAAHCFGWKSLQISNGFDAPPLDCPVFGYGMRGPHVNRLNDQSISELNTAIAGLADLGSRREISLSSFLSAPKRVVQRVAEADPYGPRDDVDYIGPLSWPGQVDSAVWPENSAGRFKVFAYLRKNPLNIQLLKELLRKGASVLCVCPDGDVDASMSEAFLKVVEQPVSMSEVWQQADAVVSYGATTFVCQALLAGKPQLIMPTDIEKWMVSRRMASAGTGVTVRTEADIPKALGALHGEEILSATQQIARRYAPVNWMQKLDALMQAELFC